jgi:hypothetical protein
VRARAVLGAPPRVPHAARVLRPHSLEPDQQRDQPALFDFGDAPAHPKPDLGDDPWVQHLASLDRAVAVALLAVRSALAVEALDPDERVAPDDLVLDCVRADRAQHLQALIGCSLVEHAGIALGVLRVRL